MSMIAYVDGAWLDHATASVPISDRGFLMGDGAYDTCRVFEGEFFRFEQHAERLRASAAVLRIDAPSVATLRDVAATLLTRNRSVAGPDAPRFAHAVLRFTVTRGSGGAGLRTAGAGPARLVATLRPLAHDWRDRARSGWSVVTATTRHPPAAVLPPALKGQGRVFSLLAALEAEAAGCDDALLLSTDDRITEGTTWNVFWRLGDVLRTPSQAEGLLSGVTRELVLDLARDAGYHIEEGGWPRSELDGADEVFATMTSLGIVPIHTLDGRRLPGTGEVVDRLTPRYWELVRRETHG
jgi:branched-chain amino acid aminotransferase